MFVFVLFFPSRVTEPERVCVVISGSEAEDNGFRVSVAFMLTHLTIEILQFTTVKSGHLQY